jgi:hypothetical protein
MTAALGVTFAIAAGVRAQRTKPIEPIETAAKPEPTTLSTPRTPQLASHVNRTPRGYPDTFRRVRAPVGIERLKHDLESAPEILLEEKPGNAAAAVAAHAAANPGSWHDPAPMAYTVEWRLDGVPKRKGADCYLFDIPAKSLEVLSERLHVYVAEAENPQVALMGRDGVGSLAARLAQDGDAVWRVPEAVPTLVQILQVEEIPYRRYLVRLLAEIRGEGATEALARRAAFDLSPTVRAEAVFALRNRPPDDYRGILLDTLRYPWAPAVEFAAEALVNLNQTSAVPTMVAVLSELGPAIPLAGQAIGPARELVRINHVKNCLLCHAASVNSKDLVRAIVPDPDLPPPPSRKVAPPYYGGSSGVFARADVTYLKQDFSVVHEVANPGKRSPLQRFDYLARDRSTTAGDREREHRSNDARRNAIAFALRELTGEDLGRDSQAWADWLGAKTKPAGALARAGR